MSKLVINIDATSLGHSACMLDFYRTVVGSLDDSGKSAGGYREKLSGASMTYGVAAHKFIDVAYKTNGDLPRARKCAHEMFDIIPTKDGGKGKDWLRDPRHLDVVCFNLWNDYIVEDSTFQLLQLNLPCWLCRGSGTLNDTTCPFCNGAKIILQPATEVTFSIKYFEDDYIIVNLCGTIDKIGKFKNGCFAIGDWKTTSAWDNEGYFQQFELSRQLRMYSLAIKLMHAMYPDSVLGQLGASQVGCFIDAIFLKKEPNDVKFIRSDIIPIRAADIDAFQLTLDDKIKQLSSALRTGYLPKEGILNGSCIKPYGKCSFWDVCRHGDQVADVLLKRDFNRVQFDPLKYNEV